MNAFAIHVHPVFHLFRAAHPYLKREGGAVLLVSSVAGLRGCPGTPAYQTVKGALIPLAKALAFDHAKENIRVNLVTPGIIRTRFHDAMSEQAKTHNLANRILLGREGSSEDVAEAAMALITNEFITGEYLIIDGGMSMRDHRLDGLSRRRGPARQRPRNSRGRRPCPCASRDWR